VAACCDSVVAVGVAEEMEKAEDSYAVPNALTAYQQFSTNP
jgi:hypothetical protein